MPAKNKSKKNTGKKAVKKSAPAKKKILKAKKNKVLRAVKTVRRAEDFEKFAELRDVVERLPDMPLPGAPKELPKDLPEENPTREPALIPAAALFEGVSDKEEAVEEAVQPAKPKIVFAVEPQKSHGVWVAVAATFSIIAVVWFATLGGTLAIKGTGAKFETELKSLSAEWQGAAETMKGALEAVGARINTAGAEGAPSVPEGVVQAVGARVIFEAAQAATSTEN